MATIPGMFRAAAVSPRVHLANPAKNAQEIADSMRVSIAESISVKKPP